MKRVHPVSHEVDINAAMQHFKWNFRIAAKFCIAEARSAAD